MQARLLSLCLAALWASQAQAGLFDDEEARKALAEHKTKTEARFEQQAKAQLDLSSQIARQAEEIAQLRGQLETLGFELETTKKRQQDFYLDLDARLRRFESGSGPTTSAPAEGSPQAQAATDPAVEAQSYESALNLFKAGKYKEAAAAFSGFMQKYPDGQLAPNAQFWLGNAWYAQRNCTKAIEAHSLVTSKYASSPKAPDAWLAIAGCQQELGNTTGAKRSLETLIAKYPDAPATETARQRLKKK